MRTFLGTVAAGAAIGFYMGRKVYKSLSQTFQATDYDDAYDALWGPDDDVDYGDYVNNPLMLSDEDFGLEPVEDEYDADLLEALENAPYGPRPLHLVAYISQTDPIIGHYTWGSLDSSDHLNFS